MWLTSFLSILCICALSVPAQAQQVREFRLEADGFYPQLTGKIQLDADGEVAGELYLYAATGELTMREKYAKDGGHNVRRITYWPKSNAGKEKVEMRVHRWNDDGTESTVTYRPTGKLLAKRQLAKNPGRLHGVDKAYDFTEEFFYATGQRRSVTEGYLDRQGRTYFHGQHRAYTPSGVLYAEGRFYEGKQIKRSIYRETESQLSGRDREIMNDDIEEGGYITIPKVVWERALGVDRHADLGGQ